MIGDVGIMLIDVFRMVYFLTGEVNREKTRETLLEHVKYQTINKGGRISSYRFDEASLWSDFFWQDENLSRIMNNRQIDSMDDLKARTYEYVEKNRGKISGDLFPA